MFQDIHPSFFWLTLSELHKNWHLRGFFFPGFSVFLGICAQLTYKFVTLCQLLFSDDCVSFFSISQSSGVIGGIDDIVTVDIGVEELAPVNEALYTLVWDTENVEAPTIEDSDFTKYFNINNDMVNDTWIISVKKDLKGLPDYNPTVQVSA